MAAVCVCSGMAEAATRMNGNFSLEKTFVSDGETPAVTSGGFNFEFIPATRKFRTRFNVPLYFSTTGGENFWDTSPKGNFVADVNGEWFDLNLLFGQTVSITSFGEVVETKSNQIGYSLHIPDLPTFNAGYYKTERESEGTNSITRTYSLSSAYRFKWINFRGSVAKSDREINGRPQFDTTAFSTGVGANYEVLPGLTIFGDYDFSSYTTKRAGSDTGSNAHAFRTGFQARPIPDLMINGDYSKYIAEESESDLLNLVGTLFLTPKLGLNTSYAGRSDNGEEGYSIITVGTSYADRFSEAVRYGVSLSRSLEEDPNQGENVRDTLGLNATLDVFPGITARATFSVSRNENEKFLKTINFDASGPLAERANYDDRPAGFIFFDTENNDLYIKNSLAIGDWSAPVHIELSTEQFQVSKSMSLNMTPTDKTSVIVSYTSSANSEQLDLFSLGSQVASGALTYRANRRTSYSLSGAVTMPEGREKRYSGVATFTHRMRRGPIVNLSYGWQSPGVSNNQVFASFGIPLRKRTSLSLSFSSASVADAERTYYLRIGLSKNF